MTRVFQREIIRIGVCIALMCFTATSTWQTDFLTPKWMLHFPDDNQTGVPRSLIKIQNLFYPTKRFLQNIFTSQNQVDRYRMIQRVQQRVPKSTKPFCNTNGTRSATRPKSVHELRPGDIDVIGTVGDSLTVGTGSFSLILPGIVVDHRGTSFSGGGQGTWKEFLTLPNILKVFNPKLIGYAYGNSQAQESFSQFNVADLGALSRDVVFMTKELVKRIKMDKRVNVNEDWKMISILMGPNTFCQEFCYEDYTKLAEKHKEYMLMTLRYLKENLPRTIVNIIVTPNLKFLMELTNLPSISFISHIIECPCLFSIQYKHKRSDYIKTMTRFQEVEKEIGNNEEFKNKEDFAVVVQTFTEHLTFPLNRFNTTDVSYLSSDYFHLSQKGYARGANSLWNNLMEPVGRKSSDWSKEFDRFICPTDESPYIRTWKNSIT